MKITIRKVAKWKIFFDRSRQYISYITFLLMFYVALKQANNSPFRTWMFDNWYFTFPVAFLLVIAGCMLLGFIESLLKIREYEQENYAKTNPYFEEMMREIKNINDKFEKEINDKFDNL